MKQIKLHSLFIALTFVTILASCHKDKTAPAPETPTAQRAGVYVLNQGSFSKNNSTLTYYDYSTKTLTADLFVAANTNKLGDTGNDLGIYGSKMYIVVNNSNLVYVSTAKTAKVLKTITLNQPRSVVFYKTNAFVTSYGGTVSVIDTATMAITKTITVGSSPEQMAIANGKLYVANSGGLDYPNVGTTVSVIDLTTLTVTKSVTVIADPVSVTADTFGNVYVVSLGIFTSTKTVNPGLTVINSTTDVVKSQTDLNLGYNVPVYSQGDYVYYPTVDNKVAVYNAKTQTLSSASFITDGTVITTPYAISGDELTGEIFITDAKDYSSNGTLTAFDKTGKKEYTINTGISPGKIVLINK
jgi:YVTN family beta-propeller protein